MAVTYPLAEIEDAIDGAMAILPAKMDSPRARHLLRTIALQEAFKDGKWFTYQELADGGKGPARGGWQFERAGGVAGVLSHPASMRHAQSVCLARGVTASPRNVWTALETDEVLAAAFARLLLWTDPEPLPGDVEGAFRLYLRTWRPGAYTRGTPGVKAMLRGKFGRYYEVAA